MAPQSLALLPERIIDGESYVTGIEAQNLTLLCDVNGGTAPFATTLHINNQVVPHITITRRRVCYKFIVSERDHRASVRCSAQNEVGDIILIRPLFVLSKYGL